MEVNFNARLYMPKIVSADRKLSTRLSVRISPRMRFGILLSGRVARESLSETIQHVLRATLAGRTDILAKYAFQDIDRLWHPVPWVRLQKVSSKWPDLLSSDERVALRKVDELGSQMSEHAWEAMQSHLRLELLGQRFLQRPAQSLAGRSLARRPLVVADAWAWLRNICEQPAVLAGVFALGDSKSLIRKAIRVAAAADEVSGGPLPFLCLILVAPETESVNMRK